MPPGTGVIAPPSNGLIPPGVIPPAIGRRETRPRRGEGPGLGVGVPYGVAEPAEAPDGVAPSATLGVMSEPDPEYGVISDWAGVESTVIGVSSATAELLV